MALVKNEYNIRRILGAALKEVTLQDGTKNTQMTVLPSAYCVLDYDKNTKTASAIGGGFGHGIGMSPVSYTHLDVYKRQVFIQAVPQKTNIS